MTGMPVAEAEIAMQTHVVDIDRHKARELYREYKKHVHWSKPIDRVRP
jgi:hypothetical protein